MKVNSIKKNTLKVLVMVLLFCPAVFADGGDMGGGGLADQSVPADVAKTVRTSEDGDMGGGGRASETSFLEAAFDSIYEYIDGMI